MKYACVRAVLGFSALGGFSQAPAQTDPLAVLGAFVGQWQGSTSGKPGAGTTTREYRFALNGHFLWQHDRSVYETGNTASPQFIHEDEGYFSYDATQKKILWMQFHSEGLVNEYALESAGADGKSLEFVTTQIQNLPGFRAKKLYRIVSPDAIDETFWLAPPGKDFEPYTEAHLKRVK